MTAQVTVAAIVAILAIAAAAAAQHKVKPPTSPPPGQPPCSSILLTGLPPTVTLPFSPFPIFLICSSPSPYSILYSSLTFRPGRRVRRRRRGRADAALSLLLQSRHGASVRWPPLSLLHQSQHGVSVR